MAKPKLESVISHWQKPFADFQTSPLEFYQAVEAAAGRKEIPGLSFSRVDYTEGGLHTERRHKFALVIMFGLMIGVYYLLNIRPIRELEWRAYNELPFSFLQSAAGIVFLVVKSILWVMALLLIGRFGGTLMEDAVLSIPVVGWLYQRLFRKMTYYRIDTIMAFQSLVHASVMEVLDGLLNTKGIRLSEDEKKPVFRDFLAKT